MGKKKIITKNGDVQTTAAPKGGEPRPAESGRETALAKTAESASSRTKKFENGKVFINSSYNNTLISVTDERGNILAWSSAGSLGFSGPKKATPFAASKVVAAIAEKLKKSGPINISIVVSGVGGGRDSAVRSFANHGFNILSIKDVTPIPHNGPRPPKIRRV